MAFIWGDSWDCYATTADMIAGYWDSGTLTGMLLPAGRFAGSQALQVANASSVLKNSGVNDAVHHLTVAVRFNTIFSGTTVCLYMTLGDGATAQCSIVFRSDGVILLTTGSPAGAALATWASPGLVQGAWTAFEFEVVINNTSGRFRARKNGNAVDDFDSGAVLNTRPGANPYANRLTIGVSTAGRTDQIDDLLWRSDAASLPWVGDIRCYTRMPASDASVQFARAPVSITQTPFTFATTSGGPGSFYTPITASYDGTVAAGTVSINAGFTGNMKCSVFNGTAAGPTTIITSATALVNPTTGSNALTFPTPFPVTKGTIYWLGFSCDGGQNFQAGNAPSVGKSSSSTVYAAFPTTSPTVINAQPPVCSWNIATTNAALVSETLQDGTASYVYSSTPGHADLYGIAAIASTPVSTVAVTARAFMQKSDAGARTAAVQLKSGATTVNSNTATLASSSWGWAWRTDAVDPNTSSAWTAAAVNNAQVGVVVVA